MKISGNVASVERKWGYFGKDNDCNGICFDEI